MTRSKMVALRPVAVLCALALSSCARETEGDRIAVFTKNQTNPYFQSVRLGADNAAKQMNATVVHYVPTKPDSIPEQMSQIEDVITKRPDAIVFIPVDSQAMVPGVQKMNAARIPGGQHHRSFGRRRSRQLCRLRRVRPGTGQRAAICSTRMKGQGNVIIIEGVRGSHGSGERVRGFQKALEESPQVKLLASQPGNFQRLQALQVTENLLQAHPAIDGVMAANDAMALGAIEALDAANRKALVVGINATKEGIDAVKSGKLIGTADFAGYLQGCVGTMAAIRAIHNLPVPKTIEFPSVVIDGTNYKDADIPDAQRECPKWEAVVKG